MAAFFWWKMTSTCAVVNKPTSLLLPKALLFLVSVCLFSFCCADSDHADSSVKGWVPVGLQGNIVRALAPDTKNPSTFYAAAKNAIYRRSGDEWTVISRDLPGIDVYSIVAGGGSIYIGTAGVVYESRNDGKNWDAILNDLSGVAFSTLAFAPPSTVFAGDEFGVMKSVDREKGWDGSDEGIATKGSVSCLIVDPKAPSTIYAATGGGVFKSTDAGVKWRAIHEGMNRLAISVVAMDPARPSVLFAGSMGGALFKSTDGGGQWKQVAAGPVQAEAQNGMAEIRVQSIAVDPKNSALVYAGMVGTGNGVLRSTDGGETWSPFAAGIAETDVFALMVDSSRPDAVSTVYAATENGVWALLQNPKEIANASKKASTPAVPAKPEGPDVRTLAVDPSHAEVIYAGTSGSGILRSRDGGQTWVSMGKEFSSNLVISLSIDPRNSKNVYAGLRGSLYRSTDSGESWENIYADMANPMMYATLLDPGNPSHFYFGNEYGVGKSTDRGDNWIDTPPDDTFTNVRALLLDPSSGALIAGTSDKGLFLSLDGGLTFKPTAAGQIGKSVTCIATSSPERGVEALPAPIYAGTATDGIFKSSDGAKNWTAMNQGLSSTAIHGLVVDPKSPGTIYAATEDGVFKSIDGGRKWSAAGTGLKNMEVRSLVLSSGIRSALYAATSDGVFKSSDAGKTWRRLSMNVSSPVTPTVEE